MKRIISILLIIILSVVLVACKSEKNYDDPVIAASETENKDNEQEQIKADDENESNESTTEKNEIQSDTEVEDSIEQNDNKLTINEQVDVSRSAEEDENTQPDTKESPKLKTQIKVEHFEVDYNNVETVANYYGASDCFVGKIADSKKITVSEETNDKYFDDNFSDNYKDNHYFRLNEDFHSVVFPLNAELYIYTVEVEQSMFSIFVDENTTIKVLADVSDMETPYEVGGKYIMKGTLYQYEGETVIRLLDQFRAKVNDDGTLTGLSQDAKIFDDVKTVDEFINNEHIANIFKKRINIPTEFSETYGVPQYELITAEKNKAILEKIITDGKKAVIADSEFKMNLERKDEVK